LICDVAIRAEIRREVAKARFGNAFEVTCLERSWADFLDDQQTLKMLRYFNRTGSIYKEVVC
jgi:hypothetical protein